MARVLEVDALRYLERQQMFDGRREDLPIFLANIEDIIPVLNQFNPAGQQMLINTIKSKITGKARQIIEINSHVNTWVEIKNLLVKNFSSHKSIQTLHEELRQINYKSSVLEFFNEIQAKLSELNQKCKQENNVIDIPLNINIALRIFKTKIHEPMRTILFARDPPTIESALNILSEGGYLYQKDKPEQKTENFFQNHNKNINRFQNNKQNFNQNNNYNNRFNNHNNNPWRHNNNNNNQRPFFNQRPQYNNNFRQNYPQRQNFQQQPQLPRPEPMDVDRSGQTRRNNNIEQTDAVNFQLLAPETSTHFHM